MADKSTRLRLGPGNGLSFAIELGLPSWRVVEKLRLARRQTEWLTPPYCENGLSDMGARKRVP